MSCGATLVQKLGGEERCPALFLDWLLSKKTQSELKVSPRTFRRRTARFWSFWPISPVCDEVFHVVHVDGIWLRRICVILIAYADGHAIGWYLARSENASAWSALMAGIAPPDVAVADGGNGFEKARREVWPGTRVQRCLFHAFNQVKRCTETRPRTQAGIDLHALAKKLLHVEDINEAAAWLASFAQWCAAYEGFLKEKTIVDGRSQYKHERLRKARRTLERPCRSGALFTYLDEGLLGEGAIPATNNALEGFNGQVREVLRNHRGMRLEHMIKTVFWFCQSKMECPPSPKAMLEETPADETIANLYRAAGNLNGRDDLVERWGGAVNWSDLHTSGP